MRLIEHFCWWLIIAAAAGILSVTFAAQEGVYAQAHADELRARAIEYEKPWNLYVRRLFGCPDDGEVTRETCNVTLGRTDYREFQRAREQAKKLYQLRD